MNRTFFGLFLSIIALPLLTSAAPPKNPWPGDHRVTLEFTLVNSTGKRKFKRHYTAAWVENERGDVVKLLALWAKRKELKHVKDLDAFWDAWSADHEYDDLKAVARPSRPPGNYTLEWDGTDMEGKPVGAGTYRVNVDINREDGPPNKKERHTHSRVVLVCNRKATEESAEDQAELKSVSASYGPPE